MSSKRRAIDAVYMTATNRNAPPAMSGLSDSLVLFKSGNVFEVYYASNENISSFDLNGPAGTRKTAEISFCYRILISRSFMFFKKAIRNG